MGSGLAQSEVASHERPLEQPISSVQCFVNSAFSRIVSRLPSMIRSSSEAMGTFEDRTKQASASSASTRAAAASAKSGFIPDWPLLGEHSKRIRCRQRESAGFAATKRRTFSTSSASRRTTGVTGTVIGRG